MFVQGSGPAVAPPETPPNPASRRRTRQAGTSGKRRERVKPEKPYPEFPLFPHATFRWAKKIRGRHEFFGPWEDPEGALARYLDERDELMAGRIPRGRAKPGAAGAETAALTLRGLINEFLTAKKRRVDAGDMGQRSFADYHATCGRLVKLLGPHRLADDVEASDFGELRAALAATRGPVALGNEIGRIRSVFKFGYDAALLEKPVRFGPEFAKPPKRAMRQARHARGERMFEPKEIKRLLAAAGPQMKAMILLGLNCGLGNTDVAALPRSAIDLKKGVLDFPRPKTGVKRRSILWKETVAALRVVEQHRPTAKAPEDDGLVFVTKYGRPWVKVEPPRGASARAAVVKDAVVLEFGKLMRATKTHEPGRGFYALRHTFRTVADEVGDRPAVDLIMGHENGQDIASHYVERIGDGRLKKVTEQVRAWLAP